MAIEDFPRRPDGGFDHPPVADPLAGGKNHTPDAKSPMETSHNVRRLISLGFFPETTKVSYVRLTLCFTFVIRYFTFVLHRV